MTQKAHKTSWPKFLMVGSLLLLALFLAFWLRSEYLKEEANLQTELDRIVEDAKRIVQDSTYVHMEAKMQELLVTIDQFNTDPLRKIISVKPKTKVDTIKIDYPSSKKKMTSSFIVDNETHFNVTYRMSNGDSLTVLESFKGQNFKDTNKPFFSQIAYNSDTAQQKKVKEQLLFLIKDIHWKNYSNILFVDSSYQSQGLFVPLSKKKKEAIGSIFFLELKNYYFLLLKIILPQILFSTLLFVITCLAFFLVYRSLREQEQLMAMKNNFISNMTHELKTPISTISVALEAIKSFDLQKDEVKTNEYLDISQSELNRLSLLVNKVLTLTKFEKGMSGFIYRDVFLDQLIREILRSMKLQFETNKTQVSTNFQENTAFLLKGDSVHLSNLLYNLLDNSVKYSDGAVAINITLKKANNQIVLVFQDNGKGIPAEYQKRVFDRFFRIPSGDVHNVKGHGLGLSYIAQVVEEHKGTIQLDSTVEKGTSITIKIPSQS